MHSRKIRRIPAAFVATALLFTSVFTCAYTVNASEKEAYKPRFTEPSYENSDDVKYYYSDENIFYKYGYGMPNCTAYAWGRAYEITGEKPSLCIYDASEWYDYDDGYDRGQTPKLGAIACWTYDRYGETGGHVAVVESIDNGVITFSNSAWGWQNFYLETADVDDETAGQSDWNFEGYIYIDEFEEPEQESPDNYKLGTYTVKVNDHLNVRAAASTSSEIVGEFGNGEKIYVSEVVVKHDRVWAYASAGSVEGWVAIEYCVYTGDDFELTPPPVIPDPPVSSPAPPVEDDSEDVEYLTGMYKVIADDYLNVREYASTDADIAGHFASGEKIRVTEIAKKSDRVWAYASAGSVEGWVALDYCEYMGEYDDSVSEPEQEYLSGDINLDGYVDVTDTTIIQLHLAGALTFNDVQTELADINADGKVDVIDVTQHQIKLSDNR